eukprot:6487781-Amphidinium_carterae.2
MLRPIPVDPSTGTCIDEKSPKTLERAGGGWHIGSCISSSSQQHTLPPQARTVAACRVCCRKRTKLPARPPLYL